MPDSAAPIIRLIDRLSAGFAHLAAVAAVACVLLVFALVLARYVWGVGSVAAQDAMLWLHGAIFLFGSAAALRDDRHVRVDVLSTHWSARRRAAVELAGIVLCLLPFCVFVLISSWDFVAVSLAMREGAREPGGLPAVYLFKAMLPLGAAVLALQGVALALRALQRLRQP
jgi:TRAP-type mannitol/chloroaromatic compound transport system permease small subunit